MSETKTEASASKVTTLDLVKQAQVEQIVVLNTNRRTQIEALADFDAVGGNENIEESLLSVVNMFPNGVRNEHLKRVFPDTELAKARTAADGMRLIVEQRLAPSLVLVDSVPPDASAGFFRWLRARPELADVPLLVVTTLATIELQPQITAVLRKPCRPDRLLAIVDALCGNSLVGRAEAALRARRLRMGGTTSKIV